MLFHRITEPESRSSFTLLNPLFRRRGREFISGFQDAEIAGVWHYQKLIMALSKTDSFTWENQTNPECFTFVSHFCRKIHTHTHFCHHVGTLEKYGPTEDLRVRSVVTAGFSLLRSFLGVDTLILICCRQLQQHNTQIHICRCVLAVVCAQTLVHVNRREHVCCQY